MEFTKKRHYSLIENVLKSSNRKTYKNIHLKNFKEVYNIKSLNTGYNLAE